MKIIVEISPDNLAEFREVGLANVSDIEEHLRAQLDDGVLADGEAGVDWMPEYELVVQVV